MKKSKLIIDYQYDFELIGIIAEVKDYKLVWAINQSLGFDLIKAEDIVISFTNRSDIHVSNYQYATEYVQYHFINNEVAGPSSQKAYLLPELSQFAYLLKVQGDYDSFWIKEVTSHLKSLNLVRFIQKFDLDKLKNKDHLIF